MANIDQQRLDLDKEILLKTITLNRRVNSNENSIYGSETYTTTTEYTIYGKITPQGVSNKYVRQGLLNAGDAIGIFRWTYTAETDGTEITPAIIVRVLDEVTLGTYKYRVTQITPITDEEGNIICYEALMTQIKRSSTDTVTD